jgi:hypothetical protein
MPKVALKDPLTRYLVGLSRELHMTYGRLRYEMDRFGSSDEIPLQLAYDDLESDARSRRAEQARRAAESLQRQRRM